MKPKQTEAEPETRDQYIKTMKVLFQVPKAEVVKAEKAAKNPRATRARESGKLSSA